MIKNILTAAILGAAVFSAQAAAPELLTNTGFDGTVNNGDGYVYNGAPQSVTDSYTGYLPVVANTVDGWTGDFVSIKTSSSPWNVTQSGFSSSFGDYVAGVQADGNLSQEVTLSAGTYVFSWLVADRGTSQTFDVLFNGDTLGSYSATSGSGWTREYVKFTVDATTTGALTFQGTTYFPGTDATALIDNASLIAVPEPGSLALMLAGVMGLVAWRRRASV